MLISALLDKIFHVGFILLKSSSVGVPKSRNQMMPGTSWGSTMQETRLDNRTSKLEEPQTMSKERKK